MAEKLSLTELQQIIKDSLYISLPDSYWVIAEISEIRENNAGHCYLELIEKHPDEINIRARVKAIIWNSRNGFIKSFFETSSGESLRVGLKVLVKTRIEYHELFGLSLIISDIDPAFTIGDMAIKRQFIIKKLQEEGIFSMNKDLTFPLVPRKIAVISSKNAAGYTDFINQLNDNSFGYVFTSVLFDTVMQGAETESSVINSLNKIADNSHLFDLAVIIRGGGSQSDLSWFDNYNIAYLITQFPLPVVTGIGHYKDVSVTDMVANYSLKTPTALADFLIDTVAATERHIVEMSSQLLNVSLVIIENHRNRVETLLNKLLPLTRTMLSEVKEVLSSSVIAINNIGKKLIFKAGLKLAEHRTTLFSEARNIPVGNKIILDSKTKSLISCITNFINIKNTKLKALSSILQILSPDNVLKRGYSITYIEGSILKNSFEVTNNDLILTRLCKGTLVSRVEKNLRNAKLQKDGNTD